MFVNSESLKLLQRYFADSLLVNLASRLDFTIAYAVFVKAVAFFLYGIILSAIYQKKAQPLRYALTGLLFSLILNLPVFGINLLRPAWLTFHIENLFVIDPPYMIPVMYLLCTYMLKLDKGIVLVLVMKLYIVLVANVLGYYAFEALFTFFFSNEYPFIMSSFIASDIVMLVINISVVMWFLPMIRRRKLWLDVFKLRQSDEHAAAQTLGKKTLFGLLLYAPLTALLQYLGMQSDPIFIQIGIWVLIAFCSLCFLVSYMLDIRKISRVDMANKDVYVHSLVTSIEDNRKLWHDMNNMLQVYDGYVKVGNYEKLKEYHESLYAETRASSDMMDINAKYESNPAMFAVLAAKVSIARQEGIHISITCTADASRICVEPRDLSRIVGILLDNAIEATIQSRNKSIFFSLEETHGNRLLLSITNPTHDDVDVKRIIEKDYTTKENHSGYGLHNLWNIINRNKHCRLNVEYANHRITFYVELPCTAVNSVERSAQVSVFT